MAEIIKEMSLYDVAPTKIFFRCVLCKRFYFFAKGIKAKVRSEKKEEPKYIGVICRRHLPKEKRTWHKLTEA